MKRNELKQRIKETKTKSEMLSIIQDMLDDDPRNELLEGAYLSIRADVHHGTRNLTLKEAKRIATHYA